MKKEGNWGDFIKKEEKQALSEKQLAEQKEKPVMTMDTIRKITGPLNVVRIQNIKVEESDGEKVYQLVTGASASRDVERAAQVNAPYNIEGIGSVDLNLTKLQAQELLERLKEALMTPMGSLK